MGPDYNYMMRSLGHIRPSGDAVSAIEGLRKSAKQFASDILVIVPSSPERTIALRALEESLMWAVKSICLNDSGPEGE